MTAGSAVEMLCHRMTAVNICSTGSVWKKLCTVVPSLMYDKQHVVEMSVILVTITETLYRDKNVSS